MLLTFTEFARPFERFHRDAFTAGVGRSLTLRLLDDTVVAGTLVSATVSDDGTEVELTVELDSLHVVELLSLD